jgi:putative endonuclease
MTGQQRAKAERNGRLAELLAGLMLQLKGYVILARRAKTPSGEIDLIARRGKVLAFIEVKARSTTLDPGTILQPRQMGRIVRGATSWAAARPWSGQCVWRYDLIIVQPWAWPVHMRDAFRPQTDPALERGGKGGDVIGTNVSRTRRQRAS